MTSPGEDHLAAIAGGMFAPSQHPSMSLQAMDTLKQELDQLTQLSQLESALLYWEKRKFLFQVTELVSFDTYVPA